LRLEEFAGHVLLRIPQPSRDMPYFDPQKKKKKMGKGKKKKNAPFMTLPMFQTFFPYLIFSPPVP